ncbi:acyl carrier protein [Streptomyces sp. NPDC048255]|uniref:acyl carrier protein n=1 Tax=Streptomyces TaxID=1883 RepID=UPI0034010E74
MSADQTLDIVVRALAAQANVPAAGIDTDKPLSAVPGIESVKALRAITDIEDECDVVIPDDFLFETATVRELAAFVSSLIPEGSSI